MQERRNSIANALELRLSCINPLICNYAFPWLKKSLENGVTHNQLIIKI